MSTGTSPDSPDSPTGYRVITAEEAEERFGVSADVSHPYQDFADEQEIRLYEGGLQVAGGWEAESDDDWVPYNTIVDGDLTVGATWSGGIRRAATSCWSPAIYGPAACCCPAAPTSWSGAT
ncbi:hypothetical protein OG607_01760 [Streptomyces sp. NBC_01537]|uniref:hypothetical protein n=1 Tax=Streptomyces sp. NBC_01537 TaxID=2903896 RepID=UPI003869169D